MPHLLMILVQIGYLFLYTIAEAVFNHGMNPRASHTCIHPPDKLQRKARPKLTIVLFLEIFVLSLLGASLTINMYFASLKCTSPTFVASMNNTVLSMTFIIAIILRLEIVDLRNPRGIAKIVGRYYRWLGYRILQSAISLGLSFLHIERSCCIIGLYMLLWGKENERDRNKSQEPPLSTYDEEKLSQLAVESSAEHT
ncbi:hypothetical protein POTOM_019944 [Populus tomentosa]|uniref:Uncharacterized protein n=1 Tax=Populus tomentosa TaxID=118781 RepID=A0A8X8A252_POPTO|nr:hypothetical protein POTOM_019944 [Populus tomentosa]